MDLEGGMLDEIRERQILYDITYMWNLNSEQKNRTVAVGGKVKRYWSKGTNSPL